MSEKYQPSEFEMKRAESLMTSKQKEQSEKREEVIERIKTDEGSFRDIQQARELGISENEIKEYARRFMAADIRNGLGVDLALRIAKNSGVLSEKEVLDLATEVYSQILQEEPSNALAAEFVFGTESPEHQLAMWNSLEQEKNSNEEKSKRNWEIIGEENDLKVVFQSEATLVDLFDALDGEETETLEDIFWSEIADNFDEEVQEDLLKWRYDKIKLVIKITDFFKKHGYSRKEIISYLPISFKKKKS